MELSFISTNPKISQLALVSIIDSYQRYEIDSKIKITNYANQKISERLNFLPMDIAELISKSAPHNTRIKPNKSSRKNINISNYFYASFQTSKQNVFFKTLNLNI